MECQPQIRISLYERNNSHTFFWSEEKDRQPSVYTILLQINGNFLCVCA